MRKKCVKIWTLENLHKMYPRPHFQIYKYSTVHMLNGTRSVCSDEECLQGSAYDDDWWQASNFSWTTQTGMHMHIICEML